MRIALALLLLAASMFGAFAQRSERLKESDREVQASIDKMLALIAQPLASFRSEKAPSCASEHLKEARGMSIALASGIGRIRPRVSEGLQLGTAVLAVADEAKKAGCREAARALYDIVIEVFIGSGYAALRQRAQIGIDDLRKG